MALLAALYILTGKLGLLLAVPPGYVTIIWPPSGIALGMLLVHGRRLWPGVLLGSLLLNGNVTGLYSLEQGFNTTAALATLGIAVGSTAQALAGWALIERWVGLPLRLNQVGQVLRLFLLGGPLACLIAASVGVPALVLSGLLPGAELARSWLAWWSGDVFGILVFVPLILVARVRGHRLMWRDRVVDGLPMAAMLVLVLPLGLTFYAWQIAVEGAHRKSSAQFESLALESERALQYRLLSYENATLGAAGFFQGSDDVSREEWRNYVQALRLQENFPGINGLGWVERVPARQVDNYLRRIRADGTPDFQIHPGPAGGDELYAISYIEPQQVNEAALGLNIDFEENRRAAAELSRDTGKAAITRRIVLVQDEQKTPGFLLLHPVYTKGLPIDTLQHRRQALRGWIYAPVIAKNFLADLTRSQGETLNLRIYDGARQSPDTLIFGSTQAARPPAFVVRKQLLVMQQSWSLIWESTPAFEQAEHTDGPLFILVGGLLFTGLFGLFLLVVSVRQTHTMEWLAGERQFALPLLTFVLLAGGSYTLYSTLEQKELGYVRRQLYEEARKIELLVTSQTDDKVQALRRMAQRWSIGGGTSRALWQNDARNYTQQLSGLKVMEWVDPSYHVRWVEPLHGNESAVGLDVRFDEQRARALQGAAEKDSPTLTEPIELVQGYSAFIAYLPLRRDGRFDGLLAGVFSIEEFFASALRSEIKSTYSFAASYGGKTYFDNGIASAAPDRSWDIETGVRIYDKQWTLRLAPTLEFIESQKTSLPLTLLVAGLLIAALSALSVRYILVSRLRASYLEDSARTLREQQQALRTSEEMFRTAMDHAPIGKALVLPSGRFMKVNPALCRLLGYSEQELTANDFQSITHPDDLERDLALLRRLLAGEMSSYEIEKRYYHKNGQLIWALLSVSLVRRESGEVDYLIVQIHDITERKEMERMKNEFISVVSHELRTPLTSIRGSLGLVLGVRAQELSTKVKSLIEIAYNNCERLVLLINDILDIDKIASGHMRFDFRNEPLAALTLQAVQENEAYARRFDVNIELQPIDPRILVRLDAARYLQVLSNLLSNAAKFSPQGERIQVRAELVGEHVRISVEDHGSGIPEEFRPRIFGKFSQADASSTRQKGGTGLGLHITKQLVERMDGRVGFDSEVGKGTTFWVEFPAVPPAPEESEESVLYYKESELNRSRVLHIEDDADLSRVLAAALAEEAQVVTAGTLRQAEELLQRQPFAIIILDIGLPDGSGLELLKRLGTLTPAPPPVVILSVDLPLPEVRDQVAAVMVKTRTPEDKIVETVLSLLRRSAAVDVTPPA